MTTVFHTTGLVDHSIKRFDIPDIATDVEGIYKSTEYELSRLEFSTDPDDESDFDKQKDKVEYELADLKEYGQSSKITEYHSYVDELERKVVALTWSILNASRRADNMVHDILSVDNKMDRNEISDQFNHIVDDATTELGCNGMLRDFLVCRGWTAAHLDFIDSIVPVSTYLELLVHESTPDNMIVGIENWISVFNDLVTILNGDDSISLKKNYDGILIHVTIDGTTTSFNTSDLKDLFMDFLHPTQEEIQMYEMASHKVYDIYKWRDIFGKKQK